MGDDILTIEEVANYLKVSQRTVYDWANKGEIPAGKLGTIWRFKKSEVENWLNARLSPSAKPKETDEVQAKNIISPDRIVFIEHTTKADALEQLSSVLATAPQVKNSRELFKAIMERENLMSTAVGQGVAIPHVRLSSVTDLVMAVGICRKPIADFVGEMDSMPVQLLFMVAAAHNQQPFYLKTISHFTGIFRDEELRNKMLNAKNEMEVYEILTAE